MSTIYLPTMSSLQDRGNLQAARSVRVRQCAVPSSIRPNLFSGD
jgi:hypothetical protein